MKASYIYNRITLLKDRAETARRWIEALIGDVHYKNLIYDILLPRCYKASALSLSARGEIEKPADDLET